MDPSRAGGFVYRGRMYRFHQAIGRWHPGHLYVDAQGERSRLRLVGVPFPGALALADLPGRAWEPDDDDLGLYADTFAEGGLEIRGRDFEVLGCRIDCGRLDAVRHILAVEFRLRVQDLEDGREGEAEGVAYCRFEPPADDVAN